MMALQVCSLASPAPGNEGYDGCLEFLKAQCRWYHRPMTVWDDKVGGFIVRRLTIVQCVYCVLSMYIVYHPYYRVMRIVILPDPQTYHQHTF